MDSSCHLRVCNTEKPSFLNYVPLKQTITYEEAKVIRKVAEKLGF